MLELTTTLFVRTLHIFRIHVWNNYVQFRVIHCISFHIRCVVMVGLPYPNIYSPELKEKMTYLDSTLGVSFSLCFDYFFQNRREIIQIIHFYFNKILKRLKEIRNYLQYDNY